MLDLKFIRENSDFVKEGLKSKRHPIDDVDRLLALDRNRRQLITETEQLKAQKNKISEEVGRLRKSGGDQKGLINEGKALSQEIDNIDSKVGEIDQKIGKIVNSIPNLPDKSTPVGGAPDNKIVREWGEKPKFDFSPKDHLKLAEKLGWISMDLGAKITGSAFPVYMGRGARLERALINFMLDLHTKKHGYQEVWPPALVNRESMFGTGQLPKLEDDMYKLKDDDFFMIPTAEVPITNLHRQDTFEDGQLPVCYTGYSPCFRREAGSYGKDTKGLSRVHQFDKIEMVKFVKPETSLDELEKLVKDAEEVLQLLEIPYRVVLLASGDLSFAAAKCYDIEAWAPGTNRWFEVSSCSVFTDFQARRMNIRYKEKSGGKPKFVHTLNGSGVALARTVLCLLENHQQKDGSIRFPKTLEAHLT
ncbi:MAG: serine--tRNA ligase [Candidatus Omnitrophica bacterium CG11_big_fil_rev_8_21_14_0_20_45_26]|uniref:Serine--tRNA ligase n=1 Tax=Candidatus Abzuiibacterium crystallinum TaxID=1974748 RepID=A0A2H0LNM7_9BACT|nr:MAG: serine--tRNA ligase [Candidatus Omnitrophica bacterium CG11_big_fil_rev_8_21_14_0_20_45_26]PIW64734.1 MAG: serine--tRNA ligase [Candidatus Omnitrophica bacterium CG12_big_fil_rev_8_21_14_0_65_45_16]